MESRAKFLGHPVHQMLIPIPAGLFIVAAVLDIVHAFVEVAWIPTVTFWNIVIGIGSALVAALFGLLDWTKIPEGTRAKRVGALHALGNVAALVLFTGSVVLRSRQQPSGALLPLLLEVLALALLGVTAWLGGELVDRMGVGVDDGAHLNAPSSLRFKQANRL
jgi:uncharacterized membrane protein